MIPIPNATWVAVPSLQIYKLHVKFVKKDILGEFASKLKNMFKNKSIKFENTCVYICYI